MEREMVKGVDHHYNNLKWQVLSVFVIGRLWGSLTSCGTTSYSTCSCISFLVKHYVKLKLITERCCALWVFLILYSWHFQQRILLPQQQHRGYKVLSFIFTQSHDLLGNKYQHLILVIIENFYHWTDEIVKLFLLPLYCM